VRAVLDGLFVDAHDDSRITSAVPAKPSALVDTRVIYCGDNLDHFKLPDGCVEPVYMDPPFNSSRILPSLLWPRRKAYL